jgi:hypothetical protein
MYKEVGIDTNILGRYDLYGFRRCSACICRKTHSAISCQKIEVKNVLLNFALDKGLQ